MGKKCKKNVFQGVAEIYDIHLQAVISGNRQAAIDVGLRDVFVCFSV